MPANSGAYRLFIRLPEAATLEVGRFGPQRFEAGIYVYLGSAKRGLSQRVARHRRLAVEKAGRRHWHVDALLLHPHSRLVRIDTREGGDECKMARGIQRRRESSVPLPGFGATDCRHGCPTHLFRLSESLYESL